MRKFYRIVRAFLTQEWREGVCQGCGLTWWSSQHHPEIGADLCAACEGQQFDAWMAKHKAERKGAA